MAPDPWDYRAHVEEELKDGGFSPEELETLYQQLELLVHIEPAGQSKQSPMEEDGECE